TGEFSVVVSGDRLPYSAPTGVVSVTVSLRQRSPCSSAVKRRLLRDGTPSPNPQRSPLLRSTPSGSPRRITPPYPDTSTRSLTSLLTSAWTAKSPFPVPAPSASVFAVGTLIIPRSANAAGCCFH